MSPRLAMFPLSTVLVPHARLPLQVFEPRYRAMTVDCLAGDAEFGVVLISRGPEVGGGDQRVGVGTVARVEVASSLPDGRWLLLTRGTRRIRVRHWVTDDPYPQAEVDDLADTGETPDTGLASAAVRRARALLSELGEGPALDVAGAPGHPEEDGWWLCAQAPVADLDRQRLLETDDPAARLALLARMCDALSADLERMLRAPGS